MNDWGMGHIITDRPDTIKIPQLYLVCWVLICRAILMEVSPSSLPRASIVIFRLFLSTIIFCCVHMNRWPLDSSAGIARETVPMQIGCDMIPGIISDTSGIMRQSVWEREIGELSSGVLLWVRQEMTMSGEGVTEHIKERTESSLTGINSMDINSPFTHQQRIHKLQIRSVGQYSPMYSTAVQPPKANILCL